MNLHADMFLPTLQSQCSEQQKDLWLSRAERFEIIGTYAQSELGHGTCKFVSSPKVVLLSPVFCQCSSVTYLQPSVLPVLLSRFSSVKCSASAPQSFLLGQVFGQNVSVIVIRLRHTELRCRRRL